MIFSTRTKRLGATLMLALALGTAGAQAQSNCSAAPALLTLAGTVVDHRLELPAIQARRFGAQAIYLMLQYGDLSDSMIEKLLADAIEARSHHATDLDFSWRVVTFGLEETLKTMGPQAMDAATSSAGLSSLRAMMLAGNWSEVMSAIAAKPASDQHGIYSMVVAGLMDQPDPLKQEMAEVAAAHGLDWLAAGIVASQADPEAWTRFTADMDQADKDRLADRWRWLPPLRGNPMLAVSTANNSAEARASRAAIAIVSHAAGLQPDREFIGTFLNQTGETARLVPAAEAIIAQYEDGSLSQVAPLDQGWLASYRAIRDAGFETDELNNILTTLSLGVRRGQSSASDTMDWLFATEALVPYMTGAAPLPSKPPKSLSDRFTAWDQWVALAGLVKSAPEEAGIGASQEDMPILAELLYAAGKTDALAAMIAAAPVSLATITMADDFAERLDRNCDAHLAQKAEAVLLAGQPIFKFFSPLD